MIKLPLWLISAMFLPVTLAAPEPQSREKADLILTSDPEYPSLPLTPLSPWS